MALLHNAGACPIYQMVHSSQSVSRPWYPQPSRRYTEVTKRLSQVDRSRYSTGPWRCRSPMLRQSRTVLSPWECLATCHKETRRSLALQTAPPRQLSMRKPPDQALVEAGCSFLWVRFP
jgi:hypothetical protein